MSTSSRRTKTCCVSLSGKTSVTAALAETTATGRVDALTLHEEYAVFQSPFQVFMSTS